MTVIVKPCVAPVHEPYTGVTTMLATTGALPVFTAVKDPMVPVPLPARPMLVLSLVQLKLVAVPVKVIPVVAVPLHTTWLVTAATTGVG